MKNFLKDLKKELEKLDFSTKEIEEILGDHEEMIETATSEGLSDEELHLKFGDPAKLAQDLKDNTVSYTVEKGGENVEGYEALESFELSGKELNVSVMLVSEELTYEVHDKATIEVYGKNVSNPDEYIIELEGNTLTLERKRRSGLHFSKSTDEFLIRVPEHLFGKVFEVKIVSGNAVIHAIDTEELVLKTTSGNIKVVGAKANHAKFTSVSGDLSIKQGAFKTCAMSTVSGDQKLFNVQIEQDLDVNTVSGDLKVEDASCKHLGFKTVSGDCKGKEFYPESLSLKSVSGDIKIQNQEDKNINVVKQNSISRKVKIK